MSGPADEVHIPDTVRLKTKSIKRDDGKDQVVIELSELLPVALEYASTPMKRTSSSGACGGFLRSCIQSVVPDFFAQA